MRCTIRDGKLVTESCEVNAVHHCNLSCRGCSHLSPVMRKQAVDPASLYVTLQQLARVLAPNRLQIVGGEPLLHPDLAEVAHAIKRSGISQWTRVITNATLLHRFTPALLSRIDEVHLSIYPSAEPDPAELESALGMCSRYNVLAQVKHFDFFREPFSSLGTENSELVQRIYSTCKMAHSWHCHTVEGEFFYKCPQSFFLQRAGAVEAPTSADRIVIDGRSSLRDELQRFLESPSPLRACSKCIGSVGKLYRHQQSGRKDWQSSQECPTEDLVDTIYLAELELENDVIDNMCVRSDWQNPANAGLVVRYPQLRPLS